MSRSVEKSLLMRIWTYRKADCETMVRRNAKDVRSSTCRR